MMYLYPLIAIAVLLLILLIVVNIIRTPRQTEKEHAYHKRPHMTEAEQVFFKVLEQAVGDSCYISTQVSLASLVAPKDAENIVKITHKSVDFLVTLKRDLGRQLIIELDDSTHDLPERRKRDLFVDYVCRESGVKIVHQKVKYLYSVREVTDLVYNNI